MSDTKNWVKPYTLGKVDIFEDLPNRHDCDELGLLFTEAYREEFRREASLNSEKKETDSKIRPCGSLEWEYCDGKCINCPMRTYSNKSSTN